MSGNHSAPSPVSIPLEIAPPSEIIAGHTFSASTERADSPASNATDGNLSTYWHPSPGAFYFQVDLGSMTPIDYIEIHQSDVQTSSLGLAAGAILLSDTTFPETTNSALVGPKITTAVVVDRYYSPVVTHRVGEVGRSIRLDSFSNFGQAIDEFRVFTT